MTRMLGDVRQVSAWRYPCGHYSPDRGKRVRTMKRIEQRRTRREIIEQIDEADDRVWLPVRLPVS